MERNTLTSAGKLSIGDRFYKATDHSKTVLQIVVHKTMVTKYRTYNLWCKTDTDRRPHPIIPTTQVIFLRNANDAQPQ